MQSRSKQQLDSNTSRIIQLHLSGIPSGFSVIQNQHARYQMYAVPLHKNQTKARHITHVIIIQSSKQVCNSENFYHGD